MDVSLVLQDYKSWVKGRRIAARLCRFNFKEIRLSEVGCHSELTEESFRLKNRCLSSATAGADLPLSSAFWSLKSNPDGSGKI
ncbi:hypothetical protein DDZ16_14905 [Marinilabilia rubra]|uniref:Uncharacterized protein n=1 Tax=Marinilabilia rubra TaxID=2162893 RepID=A0A2U2B644_9BACT|nr:hypothetical protein DDZ16_14905 [Marinilabilia rubra]